jgi:hypothetical protein
MTSRGSCRPVQGVPFGCAQIRWTGADCSGAEIGVAEAMIVSVPYAAPPLYVNTAWPAASLTTFPDVALGPVTVKWMVTPAIGWPRPFCTVEVSSAVSPLKSGSPVSPASNR